MLQYYGRVVSYFNYCSKPNKMIFVLKYLFSQLFTTFIYHNYLSHLLIHIYLKLVFYHIYLLSLFTTLLLSLHSQRVASKRTFAEVPKEAADLMTT